MPDVTSKCEMGGGPVVDGWGVPMRMSIIRKDLCRPVKFKKTSS